MKLHLPGSIALGVVGEDTASVPPCPAKSCSSNLGDEGKGFINEIRRQLGSENKEEEF